MKNTVKRGNRVLVAASTLAVGAMAFAGAAPAFAAEDVAKDSAVVVADENTGGNNEENAGGGESSAQQHTGRYAGENRYGTAAALLEEFGNPGKDLFIASGQVYADALTVAPAVHSVDGNLALTAKSGLSDSIKKSFDKLYVDQAPSRVYIIGGESTLPKNIETDLQTRFPTSDIVRLGGADRYETSRRIAARFFTNSSKEAFLATGQNFPDSLSAGAVAGALNAPVILVNGSANKVDDATLQTLESVGADDTIIAGGEVSVTKSIETQLKTKFGTDKVQRKSGLTRYATNYELNLMVDVDVDSSDSTVWLASGQVFPDALSVSAIAARPQSRLYLTRPDCMFTYASQIAAKAANLYIAGGKVTVSDAVAELQVCK